MTDMPSHHFFKWFTVTMVTVCIPFFLMIGSLNTTSGMEFWRSKWHQALAWTSSVFTKTPKDEDDDDSTHHKLGKQSKLKDLYCTDGISPYATQEKITLSFRGNAKTWRTTATTA
jgi:hypothetical protein